MGIISISNRAILNVPLSPFHRFNRIAAKQALLDLREAFVAKLCDEVRANGKCALLSNATNGSSQLFLEGLSGVRPEAIADPLDLANSMNRIGLQRMEFINCRGFNEELVETAIVRLITGKSDQVSCGAANHARSAYPLSPEEWEQILSQPDIKFNSEIKPIISRDIIAGHDGCFPIAYALPLLKKAYEYLKREQASRTADLVGIMHKSIVPEEKARFCDLIEGLILAKIALNPPAENIEHEFADQFWWIFLGTSHDFYFRTRVLKCRLHMAESYASLSDPASRDIERALQSWQIVWDLSETEANPRQVIINNLISTANKLIFDRALIVRQDIDSGLRIWKMLFTIIDANIKKYLSDEFLQNIIRLISMKSSPAKRDYASAMRLCEFFYEVTEDKQGALGFIASLAKKRAALELKSDQRDIDGALSCWQTAFDLCPDPAGKVRVAQAIVIASKRIAAIKNHEYMDELAVLKLWMSALQMEIPLYLKYELIMSINSYLDRSFSLRNALLKILGTDQDFYPNGRYFSAYLWKVLAILFLHTKMDQELDSLVEEHGRDDLFIRSLKIDNLLIRGQTIKARNLAYDLISGFSSIKDPDIFQVQACIRAYCFRGNTYTRLSDGESRFLDKAEEDYKAAISLAQEYRLIIPLRAETGLQQVQSLREIYLKSSGE